MKKEIVIDSGSSIFQIGFEGIIRKLFSNKQLTLEEKELWIELYFLRRDKSFLKGPIPYELEFKEEEAFNKKINNLKKNGFLEFDKENIILLQIKTPN